MAVVWNIVVYSIFLLLVTLILSGESCAEKSVYHISSNGKDSEVCLRPGQLLLPCASLSFVMQHVHSCATIKLLDNITLSNTVIEFNSSWKYINLEGLRSQEKAIVMICEGKSGIRIDSTSHINLEKLVFISCVFDIAEKEISPYPHGNFLGTSIFIKASMEVVIQSCSFLNASKHSIVLSDVYGNVNISFCNFTSSKLFIDNVNTYTGGIVIRQNSFSNDSFIKIFFCIFTSNFALNTNCKTCMDFFDQLPQQYGACINIIRWGNANNFRNLSITIDHNNFTSNEATNGGAISAYFYNYGNLIISNSNFTNNTAVCEGGALFFVFSDYKLGSAEDQYHSKLYIIHSNFTNNKAYSGGALTVTAGILCDKICYRDNVYINNSLFRGNTASGPGFAVSLKGPEVRNTNGQDRFFLAVHFIHSKFENNWGSNNSYGALAAKNALLDFVSGSATCLYNTTGGAMTLLNTHAVFGCNLTFCENSGTLGGAVYLDGNSDIELKSWSNVRFINNTASVHGGAIFSEVSSKCTFNVNSTDQPLVSFKNNSAGLLNQSIYIKNIGICKESNKLMLSLFTYSSNSTTEVMFPLHNLGLRLDPNSRRYMLGEIFHVSLLNISDIFGRAAVGIGYLNLIVIDKLNLNKTYRIIGPSTIGLDNYTKEIDFIIQGPEVIDIVNLTMKLFFDRHQPYGVGKVDIDIELVPCYLGHRYEDGICICEDDLVGEVMCLPHTQNLCIRRHYWFSSEFNKTFPCPSLNCLYMNNHCPRNTGNCTGFDDYCYIRNSDDVCNNGRSGFLCSQCADGNSLSFAAVKCSPTSTCSSGRLLILLLALLVYWTLLILAIAICILFKLSVRSGFMYGIVYFFSVAVLYTKNSELFGHVWLQIFMYIGAAITLLDPELLGYINFCFVKSWTNPLPHELFRYATPIFVITTICVLIFLSRHCRIPMPKRLSFAENSPIHVICLLILLSYTSISYTSLKLLIPMEVNGSLVVQVAPTVAYFHTEHIPYAVVAIIAELFFTLPLCFLFLFAPIISRRVNLVKFRLKPIIDEFQACYKSRYRWYAGFYFIARQIIYLVHGIILGPFPHSNNVLTSVNIIVLLLHITIQPYSTKWLNILDTILLTDIVVMSMYSPEKITTSDVSRVTQFFNSTLIPYALAFLPTMLVLLTLGLNTLNRIFTAYGIGNPFNVQYRLCGKHNNRLEKNLESVSSEHYNFREPLLDDLNSSLSQNTHKSQQASKSYGTLSYRFIRRTKS